MSGLRQLFFFNDSFAKFFNAISQRRFFRPDGRYGIRLFLYCAILLYFLLKECLADYKKTNRDFWLILPY